MRASERYGRLFILARTQAIVQVSSSQTGASYTSLPDLTCQSYVILNIKQAYDLVHKSMGVIYEFRLATEASCTRVSQPPLQSLYRTSCERALKQPVAHSISVSMII